MQDSFNVNDFVFGRRGPEVEYEMKMKFSEEKVRSKFVKKVFSIIGAQLILTAIIISISQHHSVLKFVSDPLLMIVNGLTGLFLTIMLICSKSARY